MMASMFQKGIGGVFVFEWERDVSVKLHSFTIKT
jgi:hypothetical protein